MPKIFSKPPSNSAELDSIVPPVLKVNEPLDAALREAKPPLPLPEVVFELVKV